MNTAQIKEQIKIEFENKSPLFENYFADAVESANNSAIDSTSDAFSLNEYDGVEFYEDGINGIEDIDKREKIDAYYFNAFETSLRLKAKGIIAELA